MPAKPRHKDWLTRLGLQSPLARRLVVSLVLVSSLLALLVTLAQLYVDYRHDTDSIRNELQQIEQSFSSSLKGSVWTLDDAQINAQLKGILALPHIKSVLITVNGETQWAQGESSHNAFPPRSKSWLTHRFELTTNYKNHQRHIGTVIITASLTEVYRHLMDKAIFILLSNSFKTLVVVGVVFMIFQLTVTRRLNALAQYANALDPPHEPPALPSVHDRTDPRSDEIDQLAHALHDMQERLAKAYRHLAVLNDELRDESISHQAVNRELAALSEQLEDKVQQRTKALEASNQELESFAYAVSHDLRAPLRSICGFSQALQEDCIDMLDQTGLGYLQRVNESALRMGQLIEDLLKLSRISQTSLHCRDVDLSAIAREIAEHLQQADPERQVKFSIQPDVHVWGDPGLLRIVLDNLLGNAWKYTAKEGEAVIEFGCENDGHKRTCHVRDNGAGFDMRYADKLFAPFQRLHHSSEFSGEGIGLATVARVINRHGGYIWADAKPNQGATFSFTLPNAPQEH